MVSLWLHRKNRTITADFCHGARASALATLAVRSKEYRACIRHPLPITCAPICQPASWSSWSPTPLCLGIALASGAPLFAGIIAGIVGGIVVGAAQRVGSGRQWTGGGSGGHRPHRHQHAGVVGSVPAAGRDRRRAADRARVRARRRHRLLLPLVRHQGDADRHRPDDHPQAAAARGGLRRRSGRATSPLRRRRAARTPSRRSPTCSRSSSRARWWWRWCRSSSSCCWERPFIKQMKASLWIQGPLVAVATGVALNELFKAGATGLTIEPSHLVQIPVASSVAGFVGAVHPARTSRR